MEKLLQDLTILDFSSRLPGPLAGHALANLGARVIKVENKNRPDPFHQGLFAQADEAFQDWYQQLNQHKEILRLDFTQDHQQLQELLTQAQGIIIDLPAKVRTQLKLTHEDLRSQSLAVVELASQPNGKPLHDLNALAETGLLKLHIQNFQEERINPPFLPIAGTTFAQQIALQLLAAIRLSEKQQKAVFTTVYLKQAVEDILKTLYSDKLQASGRTQFLHNGRFPSYNIYKQETGYAAVAAVEDKFWKELCESSNFEWEERFQPATKILNSQQREDSGCLSSIEV